MNHMKRAFVWTVSVLLLAAMASAQIPAGAPKGGFSVTGKAADTINAEDLLRHIKKLSSDEFEGRGPGTKGEELSVKYLSDEFKRMGLKPGNPNGTYVQKVPLMGFTTSGTASITAGGKEIALERNKDYVAVSRRFVPDIDVADSEVVFVGYGVVAPEYGWDDYKDVDVRGKTIVMLVNDPAIPDPKDPSKLDQSMFNGKAMTYYGRWTYKYEIASAKGAAAAIIIHDTIPAGYPFEVVTGSWGRENFDIQTPDKNAGRVAVESWISNAKARELITGGGQDLDKLQAAAIRKDFKPVTLNARATFHLKNQLRPVDSQNVIAKLEGTDAAKKNEYVVYSAHWDHLGKDPNRQGDQIFNGALDNASGCAALLELAEAYSQLKLKPPRSVIFLAVTAEEKGLLGSKYYANNPLYPLNKTLANINMDGVNQWGRTKDVLVVGYGNSTLDDMLRAAAERQGRTIGPEKEPEKGGFYRSDHFEFAKKGVPALYVDAGDEFVGKAPDYAEKKRDEYTANDYHKPSDEVKPDWDLSGAVEDLRLLFQVGWMVANANTWPEWKPGTEFKAIREESLIKPVARNQVPTVKYAHRSMPSPQVESASLTVSPSQIDYQSWEGGYSEHPYPPAVVTVRAGLGSKHRYHVTAGRIIGKGGEVQWDLTNVLPGIYKMIAEIENETHSKRFAIQRIEVRETRAQIETSKAEAGTLEADWSDEDLPDAKSESIDLTGTDYEETGLGLPEDPDSSCGTVNRPPVVALTLSAHIVQAGLVTVQADAKDPDFDTLLYTYSPSGGKVTGDGPSVQWDLAGVRPGVYYVMIEVNDGCGAIDLDLAEVTVT
jgi:Zn-dependent M28 family amino/carboxypeptidase